MIVFDTSTLVGVLLKANSVPERALVFAVTFDRLALSTPVVEEMEDVFHRRKFGGADKASRIAWITKLIYAAASWFEPTQDVTDCRDPNDNKYLELALVSGAETIVSSDGDLLALNPWRGVSILRPAGYLSRSRHDE